MAPKRKLRAARGRGRPVFAPKKEDRKRVQIAAAAGWPHEKICRLVFSSSGQPIDDKTLRKHFRKELDVGRAEVEMTVLSALVGRAETDTSAAAAIFLGKTLCGLKETNVHELVGKDGGPIETSDVRKRNHDLIDAVAGRAAGPADEDGEE